MTSHVACFKCDAVLTNIGGDTCLQPNDGLCFETKGHYGSTFFDPMDGSVLEIVICDKCLRDTFGDIDG